LHSSAAGPKAAQGGIDVMVLPALPVPLLDAAPAPLDPKPLLFGPVGALQNVAVISSSQITPVLGSDELFIAPPAPSGCCCCDCAATGDAAKSSAKTIASFVISATRFFARPQSTIVGIQLDVGGN
jgi:hypothetical protein